MSPAVGTAGVLAIGDVIGTQRCWGWKSGWSAWCFSYWGSFSSPESIGWRPCRQRDTRRSSARVVREVTGEGPHDRLGSGLVRSLGPDGGQLGRKIKIMPPTRTARRPCESAGIARLRAGSRGLRQRERPPVGEAAAFFDRGDRDRALASSSIARKAVTPPPRCASGPA